jgi:hypothetical protein
MNHLTVWITAKMKEPKASEPRWYLKQFFHPVHTDSIEAAIEPFSPLLKNQTPTAPAMVHWPTATMKAWCQKNDKTEYQKR